MAFDSRIFEAIDAETPRLRYDTRVGRSQLRRPTPGIARKVDERDIVDRAVLTVVLQRCIVARRQHGASTTELAAAHIADLAHRMGLRPTADLRQLGFRIVGATIMPLQGSPLLSALQLVRRYDRMHQVHAIAKRCAEYCLEVMDGEPEATIWASSMRRVAALLSP